MSSFPERIILARAAYSDFWLSSKWPPQTTIPSLIAPVLRYLDSMTSEHQYNNHEDNDDQNRDDES